MALSNRQWCLAAALGTALLAGAYLPPAEVTSRFRSEREVGSAAERRYLVTRAHLTVALEEAVLASEIEALRAGRIPFAEASHGLSTELRGSSSVRVARDFQTRVETLWNGFHHADTTLRLRVVGWQSDPAGRTERGDPQLDRVRFVPPEGTDGRTCLLLLPSVWVQDTSQVQAVSVQGMGGCMLLAAFGPPGPAIGRWLRQTDYDLVHEMGWATGDSVPSFRSWFGQRPGSPVMQQVYQILGPLLGVVNPAYEGGVGSAACAAGATRACRLVLLDSTFRKDAMVSRKSPGAVLTRQTFFGGNGRIGPVSGRWVNDLIVAEGRERFGAFWQSTAAPDSAFAATYHRDMADWTTEWMQEQYGEFAAGAGLTPLLVLSGIGMACLTVLVSALATRWRTVL